MSRKTVAVADVLTWANTFLAAPDTFSHESVPSPRSQRMGVAGLLETILFATDNYAGFSYLPSEYLPAEQQTQDQVLRDGYDNTRRRYYAKVT